MATKKTAYEAPTPASDKKKALQTAISQIEKNFGKGTVMRLGDRPEMNVESIPTGSFSFLLIRISSHLTIIMQSKDFLNLHLRKLRLKSLTVVHHFQ